MKELKKYFALTLVVGVVYALISFALICYAQNKNKEETQTHKLFLLGVGTKGKPQKS